MFKPVVTVVAILVLGACSSARPGRPGPTNDRYLITHPEIARVGVMSGYDLIKRLHPLWSLDRATVYVDGSAIGRGTEGTTTLKEISSVNIDTIRFLDAAHSYARFGAHAPFGAILVERLR